MTFTRKTLSLSHWILGICTVVLIGLHPAFSHAADSLKAAVAANFMLPFKEITAAFEAETKIKVEATYSSTGSLYGQIINGAPYDVFLSADEKTPRLLFEKSEATEPLLYATGRVVLWGGGKELCDAKDWKEALKRKGWKKIAIANPVTAPYGAAAETALKKSGLWGEINDRVVIAQNVGQSFQYAVTGGTDGSFCALSSALSDQGGKGCHYLIEEAPPIRQAACLINRTARKSDASRLLLFLNSPKALEIKKRYGYF
ncbi:MAG TPA: molybdate ABC transporter substrate-binding protein [Syntrophales bacterium]|nr:molybdate ABC transporter substrate-binding protein [Syntrophales bacterium]